jgi:hypothetical protein
MVGLQRNLCDSEKKGKKRHLFRYRGEFFDQPGLLNKNTVTGVQSCVLGYDPENIRRNPQREIIEPEVESNLDFRMKGYNSVDMLS